MGQCWTLEDCRHAGEGGGLESHLDSKILLSEDSKYRNLYSWFLYESDDSVDKNDRCQVPWDWSLYFTFVDITLTSSFSIENDVTAGKDQSTTQDVINARLVPNDTRNTHFRGDAAFSMLGTNRYIQRFPPAHSEKFLKGTKRSAQSGAV